MAKRITNIGVHHTGGLLNDPYAKTQHLTAEQVDAIHKERYEMQSTLGRWGGYNFYIGRDGSVTQFRAIGEETAAQRGHNFDTISICLAGNFSKRNGFYIEYPELMQTVAFANLALSIFNGSVWNKYKVITGTELAIPYRNILPHRALQAGTECYGGLPDSWSRDVLIDSLRSQISIIQKLILKLQDMMKLKPLGGAKAHGCFEEDNRG